MAVNPRTARARTEDVLSLTSPAGHRVGEVQVVNDRFGSYFRFLTGNKSECRLFYFKKDLAKWTDMLGLTIVANAR
jgi:hypothetical protein